MSQANNKRKIKDLTQLLLGVIIIILLNYIGQYIFERFDLTQEKRYSLNEATKTQLENLEDIVYVKVYLEGELPANFKRLRDATREMLDEFRIYAGDNIEYEFVNPSENSDPEIKNQVFQELSKKGLQYSNVYVNEGDKRSEQIIFPGAIITYRDKEIPLQLLQSQVGSAPEVMLNNSIQQLEYELMSSIKQVSATSAKTIGIIQGHGELLPLEMADVTEELRDFYGIQEVTINGELDALDYLDAIIIAGPDSAFTEKDKYMIDQFVMNGGKILWLVEPVYASTDSIRKNGITMGIPRDLNLNDQLFKYGARINPDFVMDLQALPIPVVTGMIGNQPKQELFPWYYYPLLMSTEEHPIVSNLDAVKTEYISSIDPVGSSEIKKTPLLLTSEYSKVSNTPHRISLSVLREKPDERQYNKGPFIAALLLEGQFESVFKNRLSTAVTDNPEFKFKELSTPTKMIVISDADIIRNEVNLKTNEFYGLGYYKYTNRTYGNKEFIVNAMNYLLEDDGLINARSKEFTIRLLDKQRADKEKRRWQIFNIGLPLIVVAIFGLLHAIIRKRKYAK